MTRAVRMSAALMVLLSVLPSCTVLGVVIGGAVDRATPGPYEERDAFERIRLRRGQRVLAQLGNGRRIEGRYAGVQPATGYDPESYLLIDTGERTERVRRSGIYFLGVDVPGNGWLYGALFGLAVDVAVIALFVASFEVSPRFDDNDEWAQ
ncbi:MAG TPA: hypothetical protein VI072_13050 [Polyangiaceae bacterium]